MGWNNRWKSSGDFKNTIKNSHQSFSVNNNENSLLDKNISNIINNENNINMNNKEFLENKDDMQALLDKIMYNNEDNDIKNQNLKMVKDIKEK